MEEKQLNLFLKIFGVIGISYGLTALVLTELLMGLLWADPPGDNGLILLRGWGLTLLGLAYIAFKASNLDMATKNTVVLGMFLYFGPLVVISILDMISNGVVIMGAMTVGLELFFAIGSGYFSFLYSSE